MWKRDDETKKEGGKETMDEERPGREGQEQARGAGRSSVGQAVIGSSINIKGEVAGDEDLVIEGRVEGSVELDQNTVTVGPDGDVTADITARIVTVEGHVEGDLTADEQIVLRSSAQVEGDITAPRVVLEDGARFRGGVDMGEASKKSRDEGKAGSSGAKAKRKARTSAGSTAASGSGSQSGKDTSGTGTSDEDED